MHITKERNRHIHGRWLGDLSIDGRLHDSARIGPRVRAVTRCERTSPIIPQREHGRRFAHKAISELATEPCTTGASYRPANMYRLRHLSSTACCNTDDTIRLETDKLGRYTAFYTALEDGQRSYHSYVQRTRDDPEAPSIFSP